MKVTVLGSGSAYGVPYAGNSWGACDPSNPKNRRLAPSILLEEGASRLLVDMGPDFKTQAERHHIRELDGIFFTHPHADHITGMFNLPILMSYYQDRNLPLYADRFTRREIEKNWWYMFDPAINVEYSGPGRPYWTEIVPYSPYQIGAFNVLPFNQNHGRINSLGFRVGDFAYCTDVHAFPEESFALLKNLKVWIVDCNCELNKDKSHSYLEQCLRWVDELKPEMTYLTHLDYTMDYDAITAKLPPHVRLAYDNLEIIL